MAYKYFLQTPYMLNKIVPKSITKIPTFYQKKNDDKMFLEGIRNKSTSIAPIAAKYDRCFFELRTKIKNEYTEMKTPTGYVRKSRRLKSCQFQKRIAKVLSSAVVWRFRTNFRVSPAIKYRTVQRKCSTIYRSYVLVEWNGPSSTYADICKQVRIAGSIAQESYGMCLTGLTGRRA